MIGKQFKPHKDWYTVNIPLMLMSTPSRIRKSVISSCPFNAARCCGEEIHLSDKIYHHVPYSVRTRC